MGSRKERLQKKLVKDIEIFLKKKTKSDNIAVNDIKLFLSKKKKGLLSIEKNIIKCEKTKLLHK